MSKTGQDIRFMLELSGIFVRKKQILFYCYQDIEMFITGTVNSPHATLTKNGDYAITIVEQCV